jgi:hypothetical protein
LKQCAPQTIVFTACPSSASFHAVPFPKNGLHIHAPYSLVNRSRDIDIPRFKHITHFSITIEGGNGTSTHDFISLSHNNLCSLVIKNAKWKFPTDVISLHRLTIIEFEGCFSVGGQVFWNTLHW